MDLTAWSWDPAVLLGVAVAAVLYFRGWRELTRRAKARPHTRHAVSFAAGLAVIVLALCSPIGFYDQQLFSLHMTEHLLLTVVAPPLLLLGKPLLPMLWGLPADERHGVGRLLAPHGLLATAGTSLTRPTVALIVFCVTFAAWHVPTLYDAAQGQTLVHYAEHSAFFAAALLFWWPVIHPGGGARTLGKIAAIGYFTVPMMEGTLIGALLTFASRPFYATYAAAPRITGLSALDDQQIAGLIMWIPGGLVYAVAVLWLLASALRDEELAEARAAELGKTTT